MYKPNNCELCYYLTNDNKRLINHKKCFYSKFSTLKLGEKKIKAQTITVSL